MILSAKKSLDRIVIRIQMKILKIIGFSILILLYLGCCSVIFTQCFRMVNRPAEIAEGVKRVDWLPAEATDINYCRSYGFTAFEFKISEAGFRKWAAKAAYRPAEYVRFQPLTEIADHKGEPLYPIERYNSYLRVARDRPTEFDYEAYLKDTQVDIKNGLRGEMRKGSAGGYSIGYDRDTGTAYYQSNPR